MSRRTGRDRLQAGVAWPLLSIGLFLTLSGVAPTPDPVSGWSPLAPREVQTVGFVVSPETTGAATGPSHAVPYAVSAGEADWRITPTGRIAEETRFGPPFAAEIENEDPGPQAVSGRLRATAEGAAVHVRSEEPLGTSTHGKGAERP